jgi:hypothetical protein
MQQQHESKKTMLAVKTKKDDEKVRVHKRQCKTKESAPPKICSLAESQSSCALKFVAA